MLIWDEHDEYDLQCQRRPRRVFTTNTTLSQKLDSIESRLKILDALLDDIQHRLPPRFVARDDRDS